MKISINKIEKCFTYVYIYKYISKICMYVYIHTRARVWCVYMCVCGHTDFRDFDSKNVLFFKQHHKKNL